MNYPPLTQHIYEHVEHHHKKKGGKSSNYMGQVPWLIMSTYIKIYQVNVCRKSQIKATFDAPSPLVNCFIASEILTTSNR